MSSGLVLPTNAGTNLVVPSRSGGEYTAISWADLTFNGWWGCSRRSPACRFCYAADWAQRFSPGLWGKKAPRKPASEKYWRKPYTWNRRAVKAGRRLRVFCGSMKDVFEDHPDLPPLRARLFPMVEDTRNLIWMFLTKRPENIAGMVPEHWMRDGFPENVWVGVSAETQRFANERIPELLKLPVRGVRFISAEPLLGPLDLHAKDDGIHNWLPDFGPGYGDGSGEPVCQAHGLSRCWQGCSFIDWVITGGGSGRDRRRSDLEWFRSLRDQALTAGVAFHMKQTGTTLAAELGFTGKGDKPHEWPADLCIQDVPDLGAVEVAR